MTVQSVAEGTANMAKRKKARKSGKGKKKAPKKALKNIKMVSLKTGKTRLVSKKQKAAIMARRKKMVTLGRKLGNII